MEKIEINNQFEQVLNFINQTNKLIFLTGKAGTGKTTLLKYIRQNTYKQMAVVAPTGVAAINAGGSTIHSFFQFPFTPFVPALNEKGELNQSRPGQAVIKYNSQRLGILRNLELLVIDEVSMVRADMLDQIDVTLRQTRKKWHLPFGGVQLLLIGDIYQLPPVVQHEEWRLLKEVYNSPFFFDSIVLKNNKPVYIELEKIYRQKSEDFISILNKVRNNLLGIEELNKLNSHYKANITRNDYRENITLTTHNRKADEINSDSLKELAEKEYKFKCKVEGSFSEKNYPADEILVLKKGTRVMFLKNNPEKNYYNGKIGVIKFIDQELIRVKCDEDKYDIEVPREVWQNVSYKMDKNTKHVDEEVVGTFTQYPLRLAWAITIHKSQGLTFDKLIIDAAEAFSAGQVYVALSRCRSLEGLTLSSKISLNSITNDNKIINFSSTKPNAEEVKATFSSAQKQFVKTLVTGLFDFTELRQVREEMAGFLQMHKLKLNADGFEWANSLFTGIDTMLDVSGKFQNQLISLSERASDVEKDAELQDRIKKAAIYFETECSKCLELYNDCALRTESKETATEINEVLKNIFELTYLKKHQLSDCKKGFNLTDFVKNKLEIKYPEYKLNIYATAKNTKLTSNIKNAALLRKLMLLRDEICEEERKVNYMVAKNITLQELSEFLPTTESQLLQISGFGKATVNKYGERFLKVINDYMFENDLSGNMDAKHIKKKKKEKLPIDNLEKKIKSVESKSNTREQTFILYKQGKSLKEIAAKRGYSLTTIEGHLTSFIENGELHIDNLLSKEKQNRILKALENFDSETGMKPVKDILPDSISYADIKYMMAFKKRQKR